MSQWGWASESGRWDLLGPYACMAWGTRPIVIDEKWQTRSSSEVETKWKVHSRQCRELKSQRVTNRKAWRWSGIRYSPLAIWYYTPSKLLAVLELGKSDLQDLNTTLNPHSHFSSALKKPHIAFTTSVRLNFAPLHIRNIAVRAGPEVRQVSNWKVDCHSHLGCHHDNSDIVTK